MPTKTLNTLDVRSRQEWRKWLQRNHASVAEIWLVFSKRHTGNSCLSYEEAIEEAICFGWIDSLVKRLDEDRYLRKFTPRKADSRWSTINRQRYAKVEAMGLLAAAGKERPPTERNGDAPRPDLSSGLPAYIQEQLKADGRAWEYFEQLAPSCRRAYIAWIDSAKREETKQKRLREAITMLAAGKKLGLK